MAKSKKKNQVVELEENITILNEAGIDETIMIDTSALDQELEGYDSAALVMPIRGEEEKRESKKAKKAEKENDSRESKISMFLKGNIDADNIKFESEEEILEALQNEDAIVIAKFLRKNPQVLSSYFKNVMDDNGIDKNDYFKEDENNEGENDMEEIKGLSLDKKERKELRKGLAKNLERLNEKVSVKKIFKLIEEEFKFDGVKMITSLLDILDNYSDKSLNKFVAKVVQEVESSELNAFVKYLTGLDVKSVIEFLLSNKQDGYSELKEKSNIAIKEVSKDPEMLALQKQSFDNSEDLFIGYLKTFIRVAKKNIAAAENNKEVKEEINRTSKFSSIIKSIMGVDVDDNEESKNEVKVIECKETRKRASEGVVADYQKLLSYDAICEKENKGHNSIVYGFTPKTMIADEIHKEKMSNITEYDSNFIFEEAKRMFETYYR